MTIPAPSRLRQIADEIRCLPKMRGCADLALQAGGLFREAINLGAFSGPKYGRLRNAVRNPTVGPTSDLPEDAVVNQWRVEDRTGCVQVWDEAVKKLAHYLWTEPDPNAPDGEIQYNPMFIDTSRAQCWRDACARIADLIEAEAERIEKTNRVANADRNSLLALARLFTKKYDRIVTASEVIADQGLTANQKLEKIDRLITIPANASAALLAKTIGVSKQAIQKTDWWVRNRKGKQKNRQKKIRDPH